MTWRPGHACIEQEVRTLRHGETVDLTALYETYSDLLFRTALTYVSHSEDAQDVVHDVFAVYLAKRPTFQDTSHPVSYTHLDVYKRQEIKNTKVRDKE